MSNLHLLRETNLLDIPATLRQIARAIEDGKHGAAVGCAVVLNAGDIEDGVSVFFAGTGEAGPHAHLLLCAGAAKMMRGVLEGGG